MKDEKEFAEELRMLVLNASGSIDYDFIIIALEDRVYKLKAAKETEG